MVYTDTTIAMIPKVVMVCSPPRSGTSIVAGMLYYLGVPMGVSRVIPRRINPKGCFEDRRLHQLRRRCMSTLYDGQVFNTFLDRVALFRQWYRQRQMESPSSPIIGGKLGELLLMIPEMQRAIPNLHIICIDRDFHDHAKSHLSAWPKRGRGLDSMIRRFQSAVAKRDRQLVRLGVPTLRVGFMDAIHSPAATIDKIVEFCGLTPTDEQLEKAIAFVDPQLVHYKGK